MSTISRRSAEWLPIWFATLANCASLVGQSPTASWQSDLAPSSPSVLASIAYDDGTGPALFVGGPFTWAGPVYSPGIAKWNGTSWSAVGPIPGMVISADYAASFAAFDDGNGMALYVGLAGAGGYPLGSRLAYWRNGVWTTIATNGDWDVTEMVVHDAGSGPALYFAARETFTNNAIVRRLTPNGPVIVGAYAYFGVATPRSLASFAGSLYCGAYSTAGLFHRWNGSSWTPIPATFMPDVLYPYDAGNGPRLYAAGSFTSIGNVSADGFAVFDGANWLAPPVGLLSSWPPPWQGVFVNSLVGADLGGGPRIWVGGKFTSAAGAPTPSYVASWNPFTQQLSPAAPGIVPTGPWDQINMLQAFAPPGESTRLFASGPFVFDGGAATGGLMAYDGTSWSRANLANPPGFVAGFAGYYGAGLNDRLVGSFGGGIYREDQTGWTLLGPAPTDAAPQCWASWDFGSGLEAVAGIGTTAASANAPLVRHFVGNTMSAVGPSLWSPSTGVQIFDMLTADFGTGRRLFAAGGIMTSGSMTTVGVAQFDGMSWSGLGSGLWGIVYDIISYDDGTGPALYACGEFVTSGPTQVVNRIAKWDGAQWVSLGSGLNAGALSMAVHDDGSGPKLVVGGWFTNAGGATASRIAQWDGATWTPLDLPIPSSAYVFSLASFDDGLGGGTKLYVGGTFASLNGSYSIGFAQRDPTGWTPMTGLTPRPGPAPHVIVKRMDSVRAATGTSLLVQGTFDAAGGRYSPNIARIAPPRPALSMSQPSPGAGVALTLDGLFPGRTYINLFSVEPPPTVGNGPYFGMYVSDVGTLAAQIQFPGEPIHVMGTTPHWSYPPVLLPSGITLDGICIDLSPGFLASVSPVARLLVQ